MEKSYYKYILNDEEKRLSTTNPVSSDQAIDLAYEAYLLTNLILGHSGFNDNSDAIRHCLWSGLIALKVNPEWAKIWTDAHEFFSKKEEEDDEDNELGHEMDRYNNSVGIAILKEHPNLSESHLIHHCIEKLQSGKLTYIIKNSETLTPTRPENTTFIFDIYEIILQKVQSLFNYLCDFLPELIKKKNADNTNALHFCAQKNFVSGINSIISRSLIEIDCRDNLNDTPLVWAINSQSLEATQTLIDLGAMECGRFLSSHAARV